MICSRTFLWEGQNRQSKYIWAPSKGFKAKVVWCILPNLPTRNPIPQNVMSKTASPFWCKIKGVSHAGSWCNIWFFRSVHRLTGPGWCLQMAVKFKLFHLHPLISCHPHPSSLTVPPHIPHHLLYPVADPGFPRGGGANPLGANIRFCQIFPKTAWNGKNLYSGGRTSKILLQVGNG